ncbi:MAG: peptidoglycan-binding protein [Candidatus Sericytochromatia bacterium]|nr:peptidoglycan-binding protein [Candidatus Tanganyikabacteria bacterium]
MAVQQVTYQQQTLWAELRRLLALTSPPAGPAGGSLGRDTLALGGPFALPAKGTLAVGDAGSDVTGLQQALRQLGYYREASNTGAYGWVTAQAVRAFQRDLGWPQTGEVDAALRQAITQALAGKGGTVAPPPSTGWQPPAVPPTSGWTPPRSDTWVPPTVGSPAAPPQAPPQQAPPPARPAEAPPASTGFNWYGNPDPRQYFISQIYDPRFNPYAPRSTANCGPTSLAMVLRAFGKEPPAGNEQDLILQVRKAMTGRTDQNEYTNEYQLMSAASQYGLDSKQVSDIPGMERELRAGKLVILAGNPDAFNSSLPADQYFGFSGGHFIVVNAIEGDRVVISDPLSKVGPLVITRQQLQQYMAYKNWNSGVAFSPR